MLFCMYLLFIMHHICILLYIHVTVLYYILASFQKIKKRLMLMLNVNVFLLIYHPFLMHFLPLLMLNFVDGR